MKTSGGPNPLDRLPAPKGKRTCLACKSFVAEVVAPYSSETSGCREVRHTAPLCWICAHHVVEHHCALHEASTAECECLPGDIYPARVLQERAIQLALCRQHGYTPLSPVTAIREHAVSLEAAKRPKT